jgi:hypothetical protein
MAESYYQTYPAILQSKGIAARYADDTLPSGTYLDMDNVEEATENAMVSRLGSIILNRTGTTINPLSGSIHSLASLFGYSSSAWRYAGAGSILYRKTGATQGAYSAFFNGMGGSAWTAVVYRPTLSSYPYIFFADSAVMLKDNGSFSIPQKWGIYQPGVPVQVQVLAPELEIIDEFHGTSYTFSNYTSPSTITRTAETTTAAITSTGLQKVNVSSILDIQQYQMLYVNYGGADQEYIQVLDVKLTYIVAVFTKTHATGATLTEFALSGSVASSTVASIQTTISGFFDTFSNGTAADPEDYVAVWINVSDPNNISEIRVMFDVSDGTFTSSYFYKVVSPSVYQNNVSDVVTSTQALYQEVFATAIGAFESGVVQSISLSTGENTWSPVLIKLSNFFAVGNAGVYNVGYQFKNANAWKIQVTTNENGSCTTQVSDLLFFGGYGPDSFGGTSYNWLYTFYNSTTGAESNPCMLMSNVDPPLTTTWVIPRRQPVQLTLTSSVDAQVDKIRIYRQGGTLSNFLRVDTISNSTTTYIDIAEDAEIESSTPVVLTNDVPVTSTLPVPINTTLTASLTPAYPGQSMIVPVASTTNISVHQQVTIGSISDKYREIVIVLSVATNSFQAFIQNAHQSGDPVAAESVYGQPCNIAQIAYNSVWLAGDPNNPHYLYYSTRYSPEAFGSPNYVEVGTPDDPITAIVPFQGSLYVATRDHWYTIAPGNQEGSTPTVYPTSAVHGVLSAQAWVATESEIWHQAVDGIRSFSGGASNYRTQDIEFLFQGNGSTPIVEANPAFLSSTVMTYWNNIVFLSYIGNDEGRHRLMYHTIYKRWRNDDIPATAMFLEPDTNDLLYGDANGLIHQDRIGTYDEGNSSGTLATVPIAMNLETAYLDQGKPKIQKNYNELTLDANTNGQNLTVGLLFNDGEITIPNVGTLNTSTRQKVNFNINSGDGQQAYRVALQVTGSVTQQAILYQAAIRGVELAETRQSFDTYWLKFGTDESKLCKQIYIEWNSTAILSAVVFYDQSTTPLFTFSLPASSLRVSQWVRFPAIKFRLLRMVLTSTADFQLWTDSKFEVKPVCAAKGYQVFPMVP